MIRNLPTRQPMIKNLGQLIGPILTAARIYEERAISIEEGLRGFRDPSGCHGPAHEGKWQDFLMAIDIAVAKSGLSRRELVAEIKARTGGRWWEFTCYSLGIRSNLSGEG